MMMITKGSYIRLLFGKGCRFSNFHYVALPVHVVSPDALLMLF